MWNKIKIKYYWMKGRWYARCAEKKLIKFRKTNDEYVAADFRRYEQACVDAINMAVYLRETN